MPLTFICSTCGTEKTVTKWVNRVMNRYCSRECYGLARKAGKYVPWNKGTKGKCKAWNKGLTAEDAPQLAMARGEDSPHWKGGQTSERGNISKRTEYFELRYKVFGRDNFTCQICGHKSQAGNRTEINMHHIKPYKTHPELFLEEQNCQTLCVSCHQKLHKKRGELLGNLTETISSQAGEGISRKVQRLRAESRTDSNARTSALLPLGEDIVRACGRPQEPVA